MPRLRRISIFVWALRAFVSASGQRRRGTEGVADGFLKATAMVARNATLAATVAAAMALVSTQTAAGAETYIRDTEIEADIQAMMAPIWKVAGLDPNALHIYLIQDKQLNAFVAGGQNEFINTGVILRAKTPIS